MLSDQETKEHFGNVSTITEKAVASCFIQMAFFLQLLDHTCRMFTFMNKTWQKNLGLSLSGSVVEKNRSKGPVLIGLEEIVQG